MYEGPAQVVHSASIYSLTPACFLVPGTCNNFAGIENGDLTGGKERFFRMRKRESSGCAK